MIQRAEMQGRRVPKARDVYGHTVSAFGTKTTK